MAGILDPPSTAPVPRGRRRAGSKHRRVRRVPPPRAALLRLGLPLAVLALLGVLVAVGWAMSGEHRGPLPPPLTLAAVLVAMTLVFAIAWRAGLSPLAALLAAALSVAYPPVGLAARVGVPEHLAVVGLLIAVLLLLARSRRRIMVPAAAVAAGLAAAVAPLALAAAPFLVWQVARTLSHRNRVPTLPLSGALYLAVVAAGWAILGVDPAVEPVLGADLLLAWFRDAPIAVAVSAAALVLGVLSAPLRPVAGFALTLIALSIWPDGDEVVRHTVLLAPALALLTGAAAEQALLALRHSPVRSRLAGAVGAAAVGAALVAAVAASVLQLREEPTSGATAPPPPSPSPSTGAPAPGRADRASLGAELASNPRLTLAPSARALLLDGAVDRRIPIVLAQLLGRHDLTVTDFPAERDEDPRRQVLVQQMDGQPLRPEGAATTALTSFLAALTGTYAVESITVTDDGVLAAFPPMSD